MKRRILPVSLMAGGTLVAIVVAFLLVVNTFWHDEKMLDDSAVVLADITMPLADNAFQEVDQLKNQIDTANPQLEEPYFDEQVTKMLDGEEWNDSYVNDVLIQYATAIGTLRTAAQKPQYQSPTGASPSIFELGNIPDLSAVRFVAQVTALEALRSNRSGNTDKGLTQALDIVRLGHHMQVGQATLIEYLVGSSIKQIGLSAIRKIARQASVSTTQAVAVSADLEQYRDSEPGLLVVMKMEYMYQKANQKNNPSLGLLYDQLFYNDGQVGLSSTAKFLSALDGIGATKFYYWPHQTMRFFMEDTIQKINFVQTTCTQGETNIVQPSRSTKTGLGKLLEPNAFGTFLADIGHISFTGVVTKKCNESLAISATQTTLGVSAYRTNEKKLPASLGAIVPKFLSEVPFDPYTAQPMKYLPEKNIIYSVGVDAVDAGGGEPTANWQQEKDPTFKLVE